MKASVSLMTFPNISCCCLVASMKPQKNHHHLSIPPLSHIIVLFFHHHGENYSSAVWKNQNVLSSSNFIAENFLLTQFSTQPKMFISFDVARERGNFLHKLHYFPPFCNVFSSNNEIFPSKQHSFKLLPSHPFLAFCFIGKIVKYTESETR